MLVQEDFGAWDDAQQTEPTGQGGTIPILHLRKVRIENATWPGWWCLLAAAPDPDSNSLWLPNTFYFQSCLSTGNWGITLTDTGTCRTGRNSVSWTLKAWEKSAFITVVTFHDVITWITSSSEIQNLWWRGSAFLRIVQLYRFLLHMWLWERDGERKHGCVHVCIHNHRMD